VSRPQMLSDRQWGKNEPLLPELRSRAWPWSDNRDVLEGILWMLRTGAPWRDLPSGFPSPETCWRRLQRWERDGTWLRVWRGFLAELDAKGRVDWEEVFIDASCAPAKKGGSRSGRLNAARERSGWWWSTARVFHWEAPSSRRPRRK